MAVPDPAPEELPDWRNDDRPLESPAFLGRAYPGASRSPQTGASGTLKVLIGLFALLTLAAAAFFSADSVVAGVISLGGLLGIAVAGFFVVRGEVRRVINSGRR